MNDFNEFRRQATSDKISKIARSADKLWLNFLSFICVGVSFNLSTMDVTDFD